jgi:hypothetical protein
VHRAYASCVEVKNSLSSKFQEKRQEVCPHFIRSICKLRRYNTRRMQTKATTYENHGLNPLLKGSGAMKYKRSHKIVDLAARIDLGRWIIPKKELSYSGLWESRAPG